MDLQIEAVYQMGVLKPDQPLPLEEGQRVRLTVQPTEAKRKSRYGLLNWTGSQEDLEYLINDVDVLHGTDEPPLTSGEAP
jgi:predicted DNA-binding antitoxin AbrB/MazE fold protein